MTASTERLRRREHERRRRRVRRLGALGVVTFLGGLAIGVGVSALSAADDPDRMTRTAVEVGEQGSGLPERNMPAASSTAVTASAPDPLPNVRGKVIVIDPGHNGLNWKHSAEINRQVNAGTLWKACDTTGTQTNDGYTEAAYNFDVAVRLAKILRRSGARVVLTRTNNRGWGPCITERAAIGNRANGDVAISIHADGGPASGRGFHIIYPPSIKGLTDDIARDSRRLAIVLRRAFLATGMPEANYVGTRGLNVRSDMGGINLSDVPKVLFETGNMRNATDAALITPPTFRQRAARAVARGLNACLSE